MIHLICHDTRFFAQKDIDSRAAELCGGALIAMDRGESK